MIGWAIETAKRSRIFDRIIVSTDDDFAAAVAIECGAEVPFKRPADLSDDYASTIDVVAHAVEWLSRNSALPEHVCCVYATAAFVTEEDLVQGLKILTEGDWAYVFSAADFPSSIFRAFRLLADGGVDTIFPEYRDKRSQEVPRALHDAAQFYWGRGESWMKRVPIFAEHSTVVTIPHWRIQDIDTHEDWVRAELLFQLIRQRETE